MMGSSARAEESLPIRKHPAHLPDVERSNQPVILFVTICASRRRPVLANAETHAALVQAWGKAESHRVGFYMIMPDHIHLFCSPARRECENVAKWVGYWKRIVSRRFGAAGDMWQADCWDTQLRDACRYGDKWQYVAQNPVRRGLVKTPEEWPFKGVMGELRW